MDTSAGHVRVRIFCINLDMCVNILFCTDLDMCLDTFYIDLGGGMFLDNVYVHRHPYSYMHGLMYGPQTGVQTCLQTYVQAYV